MTPLTRTERAVAHHLLAGLTNKEIAALRGVSVRTVANQVAAIFRKLTVHSRVGLAAKASAIALQDEAPRHGGACRLTTRERIVAQHVALGHSNKHIAVTLHLSEATISAVVRSAASKLGVRSRVELAQLRRIDHGAARSLLAE